ncbi:MAG: hypothetical protein HUK00_04550 [Bacteroidaceae bacterium]|nr:hypothetical protein [Bacteroidaceae bacterium]
MIKIKKHTVTGHPIAGLNGTSGRVVNAGTLSLDNLAELCAENNTVTRADTLAVLNSLFIECRHALKNGYTVSLGDLGSLQLTIENILTADLAGWNVNDNIKRIHIRFTPSVAIKQAVALGVEGVRVQVIE